MKKAYIKPYIEKILLDYSISLQMQSGPQPGNPTPRTAPSNPVGTDQKSQPFSSPFSDKPFG
jgi:hypothetical protein